MYLIAWKMLVGDRAKYFGILIGLSFASLLITQQLAIFVGIMSRSYSFITDTPQADIWVVDPGVLYIDDIRPLRDIDLLRVYGVEGVDWAVPLFKGLLRVRLDNGTFQTSNVIGIDDATLIGGPAKMIQGRLSDLRAYDAIIVDKVGAEGKLASPSPIPGDPPIPLKVGDFVEINDNSARVVGICEETRTFQSQPIVYMTYTRALSYAPAERKLLSFILVKAKPGIPLHLLTKHIQEQTGFKAYTKEEFKNLTVLYYLKYTGIPINFGTAVLLGFVVGTAIAGQTFYNFTLDSLRHFGTLKAMGTSNATLLRMILMQAMIVGFIGYGIGIGGASLFGIFLGSTELSFRLPWQLLVITATAIFLICTASAAFSIRTVIRLEPAIVFKG
ncbi:MAG: ABC transporter permease [Chlamydiales bacterium]|nr:ABC transporter permease [Chlamydiales bacterium]